MSEILMIDRRKALVLSHFSSLCHVFFGKELPNCFLPLRFQSILKIIAGSSFSLLYVIRVDDRCFFVTHIRYDFSIMFCDILLRQV